LQPPSEELNIDLDLAARKDGSNPLFAVRNTSARIMAALTQAPKEEPDADRLNALPSGGPEAQLITKLSEFPEEVRIAAQKFAPHRIAQYTLEVAALFDGLGYGQEVQEGQSEILSATLITLRNALALLGVDAPTQP